MLALRRRFFIASWRKAGDLAPKEEKDTRICWPFEAVCPYSIRKRLSGDGDSTMCTLLVICEACYERSPSPQEDCTLESISQPAFDSSPKIIDPVLGSSQNSIYDSKLFVTCRPGRGV